MDRYRDDELVFGVFAPRRGLIGVIPEAYRGGYAHNAKLSAALTTGIATEPDHHYAMRPLLAPAPASVRECLPLWGH
ncbi:hypothetical protein [Streptomyces sp. NBC_00078]|uniref:hypothetical protein n=1 Tax=unclassified Streptomyces TaxID=2593676 RepID=UPI00224E5B1B|nr:hypothetical protein [Streptomyces sp. NBC_00078]